MCIHVLASFALCFDCCTCLRHLAIVIGIVAQLHGGLSSLELPLAVSRERGGSAGSDGKRGEGREEGFYGVSRFHRL